MCLLHMATLISLSVLASFATGFVCLLVVGIKWASSVKRDLVGEENIVNSSRIICARCGTSFFDNSRFSLKDVICYDCKSPVCSACALNYPTKWLCTACIKLRDAVCDEYQCLKDLHKRFPIPDNSTRKFGRKENEVRNLMEKLTENILGICFENVFVRNLSNDRSYLEFMEKYNGVLSLTLQRLKTSIQLIIDGVTTTNDITPTKVELQLRSLIKDIITDATNIDRINVTKCDKSNIISKTYEDLLAMAILNKVIECITMVSIGGTKFFEDFSEKNDFLKNESKNINLENKLEELTNLNKEQILSDYERKIIFPDLILDNHQAKQNVRTWENNWSLRKRTNDKIINNFSKCKNQPRVSMFIPTPKNYISPKIGEASIEDISDLSDLSDTEIEKIIT